MLCCNSCITDPPWNGQSSLSRLKCKKERKVLRSGRSKQQKGSWDRRSIEVPTNRNKHHPPLLIRSYELSSLITERAATIILLHIILSYTLFWDIIDNLWCYNNSNWSSLGTSEVIHGFRKYSELLPVVLKFQVDSCFCNPNHFIHP